MTLKSNAEQPYRSQLRHLLAEHFSLDELRTLYQNIDISFDELLGTNTTSAKSRGLITYLENRGRLDDLVLAAARARPQVNWPGAPAIERPNPYLGLFAFREGDADNFFSRDQFADRLAEAVGARSLVAVVGASGSGKSSVVFAELLPRLRKSGGWLTVDFRPKSDPSMSC